MSNWNYGYVTDITYTKGYYASLNPLRIKLCFLAQKLLPPKIDTACELGFGQGITLNFNAASANASWYGTDFNPSQATYAKSIANISRADVKIYDDSFEEFLNRKDLPQFDFIALHGIYSWVSPEVREQIIKFVRQKLAVGGVCLISYNCQPGWAAMAPMRDLLRAYATHLTPTGKPSAVRAREGLEFVSELLALPSTESIKNPQSIAMLQTLQKMDDVYLAHELLNEYQVSLNFLQMSQQLQSAKLDFASYCNYANHLISLQLSDAEKQLLSQTSNNRTIYEMLKDLMFATSFRSDYFAKGIVQLSDAQCNEELNKLQIVLSHPFEQLDYTLQTYRGTLKLNQDFYEPLFDVIKNYEPISIANLRESLASKLKREVQFSEIVESLIALGQKEYVKLVQEKDKVTQAMPQTQRLNTYILEQAFYSPNSINHLISPLTAEAVSFDRFDLISIYASLHKKSKNERVELIMQQLKKQGDKISKDGKALSDTEVKQELEKQIQNIQAWIPVLQKLQILS